MKAFFSLTVLLAGSICLTAQEQKQPVVHAAKIHNIEVKLQNTPNFMANGVDSKELEPRQWLEIEAEVEVKSSDLSGYIPELQASWYAVVMKDNPHKDAKGQPDKIPVQLTGSSFFKDIRADAKGSKVYLSAYIDPRTLQRFFGDDRLREREVKRSFKGFALTLNGKDLYLDEKTGKAPYYATANQSNEWWTDWSDRPYLEDTILPKSKTPFALMWLDRYPEEKEVQ